jgi:divalent metal cation (Fe/Co/Zn/Cd) transporter
MKRALKIIISNWINLVAVFIAVFLFSSIRNVATTDFTFGQALLAALFLVSLYGIIFWIGFLIALILLDLLLLASTKPERVRTMLLIEWLLLSAPFVYWTVKYSQWIFIAGIVGFGVSQLIRLRKFGQ